MSKVFSRAVLALLVTLVACSKAKDENAQLAFVPADTSFVLANIEPMPAAAVDQWALQMRGAWSTLISTRS